MSTELFVPNAHVAIIHFPMALLAMGVAVEWLTMMRPLGPLRTAGRWMTLLGAVWSVPAATSGVYALHDLSELDAVAPKAIEMLQEHAVYLAVATGLAVFGTLPWLASNNSWRKRLYWPSLILVTLSVILTIDGAWHAGEGVARLAPRIVDSPDGAAMSATTHERDEDDAAALPSAGSASATPPAGAVPAKGALPPAWFTAIEGKVRGMMSPLQMHAIFSGTSIGLSLLALAGAWRRTHRQDEPPDLAFFRGKQIEPRRYREDPGLVAESAAVRAMARTAHPSSGMTDYARPARLSLIWLVAVVLAIGTVKTGWWYLAWESQAWSGAVQRVGAKASVINKTDAMIRDVLSMAMRFEREALRPTVHVIAGTTFVLSVIAMLFLSIWPPRKRTWLTAVAFVLLGSIAAQLWLGVWMMLDSSHGPLIPGVTGF